MNKDRRRVAVCRPPGFQHYDMCKPERDADLKHIRVRTSKPAAEKANKTLSEINEEEKRRKQELGRLIHDNRKSTYTKAQKKGVVLIKKAIV